MLVHARWITDHHGEDMNDLKDLAVAAHGGLDRWNRFNTVTMHVHTGGVLWALKGQDAVISEATVRADLHTQIVSHSPFGAPDLHDTYTPDMVTIENARGEVLEKRKDPRAAFDGHTLETPWDRLHLAYFTGYAMWTYLTQPFNWFHPGVETEELSPWFEGDETWRRLQVTFPNDVATHSRKNVYYLDDAGLIRRHDYTTEVLGSTSPAAHYGSEYREFNGIRMPTKRRVYLLDQEGAVMPEPVVVSIDLNDVRFE
jgi:hypothetical protein